MVESAETAEATGVVSAEESLERANREADFAALNALLSEDFLYTGGMGGSQSREEWLSGLDRRRKSDDAVKREAAPSSARQSKAARRSCS